MNDLVAKFVGIELARVEEVILYELSVEQRSNPNEEILTYEITLIASSEALTPVGVFRNGEPVLLVINEKPKPIRVVTRGGATLGVLPPGQAIMRALPVPLGAETWEKQFDHSVRIRS